MTFHVVRTYTLAGAASQKGWRLRHFMVRQPYTRF